MRPTLTQSSPAFAMPGAFTAALAVGATVTTIARARVATSALASFFLNIETLL